MNTRSLEKKTIFLCRKNKIQNFECLHRKEKTMVSKSPVASIEICTLMGVQCDVEAKKEEVECLDEMANTVILNEGKADDYT